jgi:mycothiol synthase
LISSVAGLDGRNPLSDQALTKLGAATVEHAIAADSEQVVGYAQLDGKSLEIAARDSAVGALLDAFAGRDLLVWTHGEHSRLVAPLDARGYRRQRELFQLRRSLTDRPEPPAPPDEVEIRPFAVGSDEDAWVAVNAAAFASHPEQGSWTRADLEAREAEEWFDPSGFLMAWRGNDLVGFHWTKMHPDGAGEVYVLAVAPQAQGLHLGSVLLLHGLAALYDAGAREVLLYVDGDNTAAVRLYERYGFNRHDLDVQWRAPGAAD